MNPHRFTDFEEYAIAIRGVDLNVRLLRPSPRRHFWSLQKLELESLQLQFAVEGGGILAQGKMHRDGWGLYVMLSGATASINGQQFGPGSFVVFPPDAEFAISGCGAVRWFSVFVPGHLLVDDSEPPSRNSSVSICNERRGRQGVGRRSIAVFARRCNVGGQTSNQWAVHQCSFPCEFPSSPNRAASERRTAGVSPRVLRAPAGVRRSSVDLTEGDEDRSQEHAG